MDLVQLGLSCLQHLGMLVGRRSEHGFHVVDAVLQRRQVLQALPEFRLSTLLLLARGEARMHLLELGVSRIECLGVFVR